MFSYLEMVKTGVDLTDSKKPTYTVWTQKEKQKIRNALETYLKHQTLNMGNI